MRYRINVEKEKQKNVATMLKRIGLLSSLPRAVITIEAPGQHKPLSICPFNLIGLNCDGSCEFLLITKSNEK